MNGAVSWIWPIDWGHLFHITRPTVIPNTRPIVILNLPRGPIWILSHKAARNGKEAYSCETHVMLVFVGTVCVFCVARGQGIAPACSGGFAQVVPVALAHSFKPSFSKLHGKEPPVQIRFWKSRKHKWLISHWAVRKLPKERHPVISWGGWQWKQWRCRTSQPRAPPQGPCGEAWGLQNFLGEKKKKSNEQKYEKKKILWKAF